MADTKISALTAATTPLAGTEVLPIVQSGVTKQVSVANLTAGRAVSADSLTLTGSPLPATSGGTGQSSYAVGDLLYASTTTVLSKLADVATGNALISGGVGVAPSWGKIGLTTHVSGILPVANGGTNASSASITAFNNITGYTASGATGTTSTNLVFSTSPTMTTPKVTTTIGVGNATAASSGSGVTFPATQSDSSDANTLDDYEEGTYTTSAVPDSGSITLTDKTIYYTKIGRTVTYTAYITVASVSSPTGNVYFTLPFSASANINSVGVQRITAYNAFTGAPYVINQGNQGILYWQYVDTSGNITGGASVFKANTTLTFTITVTL